MKPVIEPLPSPAARDATGVEEALELTRQQLLTLQSMQEQTARIHSNTSRGRRTCSARWSG